MRVKCSASNVRPATCPRVRSFSATPFRGESKAPSSSATADEQESSKIIRKRGFAPKKRILSGIQPTGVPHLGNYLGALRKWKELQDEKISTKNPKNYQLLFAVVDLHALTAQQDPALFSKQRLECFASLMAIGLDPKHSIMFMQSSVSSHTDLMWILSTIASTGYLSRMTQWKSKLGLSDTASLNDPETTEKLKLGLFSYPVLQAADILIYRPNLVPVGEDQAQHIEFTRNVARSFNAHYCPRNEPFFDMPKILLSPAKRIMSLKEPNRKMSKSHQDPMSRILITDSEEDINQKIRGALTDSTQGISYDPTNRPGVSNLIDILKYTSHSEMSCEQIATDNAQLNMRAFKELVANSITKELSGIRERFHEVTDRKNPALRNALRAGQSTASAIAGQNMSKIKRLLGLDDWPWFGARASSSSSSTGHASPQSLKDKVKQEQIEVEKSEAKESDVLPQKSEGVDHPIAS